MVSYATKPMGKNMADDMNDKGARSVIALLAPIKQGKKAANKRSDAEPKSIVAYADLAKAIEAVAAVSAGMVDLDDSSRGLLKTAALQFSVLKPINGDVWEQHFRTEMKQRYQEPAKLSRIKTAIIAFSNAGGTDAALALIDGHTSLQGFCSSVRPSLVKLGLVKSSNAGAPVKTGSNKSDSEDGETDGVKPSTGEVIEFKRLGRKEAAAILANPAGIPHDFTQRFAALLVAATADIHRARTTMHALAELFPDDDTGGEGE